MSKTTVQENLSIEKYEKDLKKMKEERAASREAMKKKLEKKGYKFQKDVEKVEKNYNKKKKAGILTDKDILQAFISLELTPMVHGATIQIRSGAEQAVLNSKDLSSAREGLPTSHAMTTGFMALIEPEIEKIQRRFKKFYKDLYAGK